MQNRESFKRSVSVFLTVMKILAIILAILVVGLLFGCLFTVSGEGLPLMIENSNISISILTSFVALFFSCITYFTVDAVRNKSAMDRNILECSNYTVKYSKIINELNGHDDKDEFQEKLYRIISHRKTHSCMEYADWLQNIIDHLIFFVYWDDFDKKKKKELLEAIEKEKKKYKNLSSGIKHLLDENVSLIGHVLKYQEDRKENDRKENENKNKYSCIEDVRGKMLVNPISKIVFYDYLSLDYKNAAEKCMMQKNNKDKDKIKCCTKAFYKAWADNGLEDDNEIKKCKLLVKMAKKNIQAADRLAEDDLVWSGYIRYNEARICIMEFLLEQEEQRKVDIDYIIGMIDDCLEIRENICFLFNNDGYLRKKFKEERQLAKNLKSDFENFFLSK